MNIITKMKRLIGLYDHSNLKDIFDIIVIYSPLVFVFCLISFQIYILVFDGGFDLYGDKKAAKVILTQEYGRMVADKKIRTELIKKYNLPWIDFHLSEGKFISYYFERDGIISRELMPLSGSTKLIDKFIKHLKQ